MSRLPTTVVTNGNTRAIINLADLPAWTARGWNEFAPPPPSACPAPDCPEPVEGGDGSAESKPTAIILPPLGAPAIGDSSVMPAAKPPSNKRSGTPKV